MSNILWPTLRYHKIQHDLWVCPKRFIYVPAGRQSGKTELALRRLVRHLPIKKPWPDPRYLYSAPTFGQAKRIAWKKLLSLTPSHWIANVSETDLCIETTMGSSLRLVGLDVPQRAEGDIGGIDGIVIDEYSDIRPGTLEETVFPMLAHRNGWAVMQGIPKRHGIGAAEYHKKYKAACRGELPESAGFSWPSVEIMSGEQVELARACLDERSFREQYEACWLNSVGGIFYAFTRENVTPCKYDPALPLVVTSDFNVSPMAWVIIQVHGETAWVIDELWVRNTNTPDTLDELLRRYGTHRAGFEMFGDASARGRRTSAYQSDYNHIANDPRLMGLNRAMFYTRSNPSVADRFAATNSRLCNGAGQRNVLIDPKCIHLIADLEERTYKPNTREADDSDKDSGHPTDALGYFLYKRWPLSIIIPNRQIITIHSGAA